MIDFTEFKHFHVAKHITPDKHTLYILKEDKIIYYFNINCSQFAPYGLNKCDSAYVQTQNWKLHDNDDRYITLK